MSRPLSTTKPHWLFGPIQWHAWKYRIVWRHVTSRWYIFRDAPDWVVARLVNCDIPDIAHQATAELTLRLDHFIKYLEAQKK